MAFPPKKTLFLKSFFQKISVYPLPEMPKNSPAGVILGNCLQFLGGRDQKDGKKGLTSREAFWLNEVIRVYIYLAI